MEIKFEKIKDQESYIHHEVYRVFKNAINIGIIYKKDSWEEKFIEILPEVKLSEKERVDLLIYSSKQSFSPEPRLVIEIKKRVFTNPGISFAKIAKKTGRYAERLGINHYIVYDGYYWFLFSQSDPYLLKVLTIEKDKKLQESFATNVLLAIAEISYTSDRTYFQQLVTRYSLEDKQFVKIKILPALAKSLGGTKWEELINYWNKEL